MKAEFLLVISEDNLELPALLFAPKGSSKVAIYIHGNGDSGVFYNTNIVNALADELGKKGIGLLALNNRGARMTKKLIVHGSGEPGQEETVIIGVGNELIEDCVLDLNGAIKELENRGFNEFYALGFSTGANKICVYESLVTDSKFKKHVLGGPGDDSGLYYTMLGEEKFNLALKKAQEYMDKGKPLHKLPKYTGMASFSAQSTLDMMHPDGPYNSFPYLEATQKRLGKKKLFEEYRAVNKPMFVVFGSEDEFTYVGGGAAKCLALLEKYINKNIKSASKFGLIDGADHGFNGYEKKLAVEVADWLSE